jgi:dethiobiotin synthetase
MLTSCFITGTDTGVGKTRITLGLMQRLQSMQLSVTGMKPVASGSVVTAAGARNEDALKIQQLSSVTIPYEMVNPYAFVMPVAPCIAACREQKAIKLDFMLQAYRFLARQSDRVVVEGVGGWRIHLGDDLQMSDLVLALNLQVILVVGLRLGCVNHAVLTEEAILNDGARLVGWIANHITPGFAESAAAVDLLCRCLSAPMLAEVPYNLSAGSEETAAFLVNL